MAAAETPKAMDWLNWLQIVEVPALGGMFMMIMRQSSALADFKVEVAKSHPTNDAVEARLARMENKLDRVLERMGGHD